MLVALPPADHHGPPFEQVLERRRSQRALRLAPMSLKSLGQLCHAAGGVTGQASDRTLRAVPSAGAVHALDIYVAAREVTGIEPGLYLYLPEQHALEPRLSGDQSVRIARAGLDQRIFTDAAVILVVVGVIQRLRSRYRERAQRYLCLEAGHAAQNVLLQAVSLGLGSAPVAAFHDDELAALLKINGHDEQPLYLMPVGALA